MPAAIRPADDDLQSLCAVGAARCMGELVPRACGPRQIDRYADDRFHAHQGTPLGFGRKRGEQKQAIGRSRGGRNTKIHAIADAKGRLLSILLSGGEAHDCPPAPRLIRRTKAAKKLLGDKAYLSITGRAEILRDPARAAEIWKGTDQVWWPGGPDDPTLRVLRVAPETAELKPVWLPQTDMERAVYAALIVAGKPVSHDELARLMRISKGESSRRVAQLNGRVEKIRVGREVRISIPHLH